jgi:hypothetical protein
MKSRLIIISILFLVFSSCSSIPSHFNRVVDKEIEFAEPIVQINQHNLDSLKALRSTPHDGTFLIASILSKRGVRAIYNQEIDPRYPQLEISVAEDQDHVRFHKEYNSTITLTLSYQNRVIYYRNFSSISRRTIDSQRIFIPLLSREVKRLAGAFKRKFVNLDLAVEAAESHPIDEEENNSEIPTGGSDGNIEEISSNQDTSANPVNMQEGQQEFLPPQAFSEQFNVPLENQTDALETEDEIEDFSEGTLEEQDTLDVEDTLEEQDIQDVEDTLEEQDILDVEESQNTQEETSS